MVSKALWSSSRISAGDAKRVTTVDGRRGGGKGGGRRGEGGGEGGGRGPCTLNPHESENTGPSVLGIYYRPLGCLYHAIHQVLRIEREPPCPSRVTAASKVLPGSHDPQGHSTIGGDKPSTHTTAYIVGVCGGRPWTLAPIPALPIPKP